MILNKDLKKINDVNSFKNHISNFEEMITYFKDENEKSKTKNKKYKTITTILKSFDTIVINATGSSSLTLSHTGIGLILIPISSSIAYGLSISNKVLSEIVVKIYKKYKKHYERDQQTIKSFDKLYRKSFQDTIFDKSEYEYLFNIFTKGVDETINESFLQTWT